MKKILDKFNLPYELIEFENISIAVLKNESDNYNFIQYINGVYAFNGGKPIEWVENGFINAFKECLPKKYQNIKNGDIKNKITIIAIFKNMIKPRFADQIKSDCINSYTLFKDIAQDVDFSKLAKLVFKNQEIKNNILEFFDLKVEFEARKALVDLDKKKTKIIRNEKFMKPIGDWRDIFLAEGDSAAASISKILGREGKGYFAMFGVPPNAYDIKLQLIAKTQKLVELKEILNINFSKNIQTEINFKNIIIATDFDLPGHFICGQLLGLFYRFGKNLFEEKRIKRFITPLVIAKDSKDNIKAWFYSFNDYFEYEQKHGNSKLKYDYKKGLGSWDKEELDFIISKDGFENMLEVFVLDENANLNIHNWLSADTADERKQMLEGFEFNIMGI